jgi:hypothetical protein
MIDYHSLFVAVMSIFIGMVLGAALTLAGIAHCIKSGRMDLFINGVRQSPDQF